jgi:hypothetical protein
MDLEPRSTRTFRETEKQIRKNDWNIGNVEGVEF